VRSDKYVTVGNCPDVVSSDVACGSGYCLSFKGPIPSNVDFRPLGSGVVIPSGWMSVKKDLVSDVVIPSDPDAAMLRIAFHLASKGVYFSTDSYSTPPVYELWAAELSRLGGSVLYENSLWLSRFIVSDDVSVSLSRDGFRPMLVSGNLSWSTKAVFDGYVSSFYDLDIDLVAFEYDGFMKMFSEDMVRKILLSEICNVDNGITHMIVIDAMSIPDWVVRSARRMGIVTVMVTTEDPHCIDATRRLHPYYDYIFSNDRNAAEMFGTHYLPVAGDSRCKSVEKDIDVLFLGAIYPNRCRLMEDLAEKLLPSGITMKVIGPFFGCKASGALASVASTKMVSTEDYIGWMARSKVCINMFRDTTCDKTSMNSEFEIPGYSLSPRCYDAFLCGCMLLTDSRPEVLDIFDESCLMGSDPASDVLSALEKHDVKKGISDAHMKTVLRGHLYAHRSICLLSAIGQGFFS